MRLTTICVHISMPSLITVQSAQLHIQVPMYAILLCLDMVGGGVFSILAVLLLAITMQFFVGPQLSRYYALRFSSIVAACMVVYELLLALGIGTWHWYWHWH